MYYHTCLSQCFVKYIHQLIDIDSMNNNPDRDNQSNHLEIDSHFELMIFHRDSLPLSLSIRSLQLLSKVNWHSDPNQFEWHWQRLSRQSPCPWQLFGQASGTNFFKIVLSLAWSKTQTYLTISTSKSRRTETIAIVITWWTKFRANFLLTSCSSPTFITLTLSLFVRRAFPTRTTIDLTFD